MSHEVKVRYGRLKKFNMRLKNFSIRLKKFSTDYLKELFKGTKNYAQVFENYYDVYLNLSILLNIISILFLFLYAFCISKTGYKICSWFMSLNCWNKWQIIIYAFFGIMSPWDLYRSLKYKIKSNKLTTIFSIVGYFVFAYVLFIYLIMVIIVAYNEKTTIYDLIPVVVSVILTVIIVVGIISITTKLANIGVYKGEKHLLSTNNIMSNAYILNQTNLMAFLSIILLSAKQYIYSTSDYIVLAFFMISSFIFIILVCICFQTRQYYVKNTLFNNNLLGLSIVKILTTIFFVIVCFYILGIDPVKLIKNLLS